MSTWSWIMVQERDGVDGSGRQEQASKQTSKHGACLALGLLAQIPYFSVYFLS